MENTKENMYIDIGAVRVKGYLLHVKCFSVNQPHHVHTLEQSSAGGGDSSVDSCIYEYTGTKVSSKEFFCCCQSFG